MIPLLLLGALLATSRAQAQTPAVTIALRAEVAVDTPEIALSQVAEITGPAEAIAALAPVLLGSAPVPGATRNLAAAYIRLRLKRYGVDPATVSLTGAGVAVQRTAVPVAASAAAPAASQEPALSGPALLDVRRNEAVRVAVECRAVVVALGGRALQDGRAGDVIRVLIPQTNRTVEAEVLGPGRLAVRLQGG
jgi:hypothetical protein